MKRFVIIFIAILLAGSIVGCQQKTVNDKDSDAISTEVVNNPLTAEGIVDEESLPAFKFETLNYDFGVVIQGEKVAYTFVFENVGKTDLIVSNVKKSCGCTIPDWTKEPVKPNGKGEIEIEFDSSGKRGAQHKTVTVYANTQPNTIMLGFTADVIEPGK